MEGPAAGAVARVLLTGAGGFIGGRLAAQLAAGGVEVHGTSRTPPPDGNAIRWWAIDPADPDSVRSVVAAVEPDAVIHLAGYVSGTRAVEAVLPALRGNLLTTVSVLAAAQELGCRRVLLAGSLEEPGEATAVAQSPYAASKWAASIYARMYAVLYETPVVTLRLFMVYGPGAQDETKLVPYVTRELLAGRSPRLSSGRRAVDWVFVDDVVDAFVAALSVPGIEGQTLDVGSGRLRTVREVVERLVFLTGSRTQPEYGAIPDRPNEPVRTADLERTRRILGWEPAVSLDEGLARTVAWFADREAARAHDLFAGPGP